MKTLSEFLATRVVNKDDFCARACRGNSCDACHEQIDPEYNETVRHYQHLIAHGIEAYQAYLKSLNTNKYSVAMREIQLADALGRIEIIDTINTNQDSCKHNWVERLDGYEEQCGPAICNLCGKYGCYCDAKWTAMTDIEKQAFSKNGINGDNHALRDREAICPTGKYNETDLDRIDPKRCDYNPNSPGCIHCTQACFLKLRDEYKPNITGL